VARAFIVAREVFDLARIWGQISELDGVISTAAQSALHLEVRRLLDRATRWVLALRGGTVDVAGEIARFRQTVEQLSSTSQRLLVGSARERYIEKTEHFVDLGAPIELAQTAAMALDRFSLLDIDDIARRYNEDPQAVAEVYFAVSEHYGIDALLNQISALERRDRWANLARAALRSDLYSVLAGLTSKVLRSTPGGEVAESRISDWEQRNWEGQQRARATLREIDESGAYDLATISVALRVLRTLVQQGAGTSVHAGQ
jgi:glutamate dehydrogenase